MTEFANSVINDALSLILVQGDEEPIEPSTGQLAIRVLNRMMNKLTIYGINLGYTTVENLKTQLTVPDSALEPIVNLLARALHPHFGMGQISPILAMEARSSLNDLLLLGMDIAPTEYPENLPRGSGIDLPDFARQHFFADLESTILAEISGRVLLEDDTESV